MRKIYHSTIYLLLACATFVNAQENRTWKGNTNTQWDLISSNWLNPKSPLPLPTSFVLQSNALFNDAALKDTISVVGEIATGDVVFDHSTLNYVLKKSDDASFLSGTGTLIKKGKGNLTVALLNKLTNGTLVTDGTLIKKVTTDPNCFGSKIILEGGMVRLGTTANSSTGYFTMNTPVEVNTGKTGSLFFNRYSNWETTTLSGAGHLVVHAPGERIYLKSTLDMTDFTGTFEVKCPTDYISTDRMLLIETAARWDFETQTGADERFAKSTVILSSGGTLGLGSSSVNRVRIGEIKAEDENCSLIGYFKASTPEMQYEVGGLNTDVVFPGTIKVLHLTEGYPRLDNAVQLIKVGTGTYTLTSGQNGITRGIQVQEGKIFISNPANTSSGTGYARNNPAVTVLEKGALGGIGRISGHVSVFGTLEPGENGIGTLLMADHKAKIDADVAYVAQKYTLTLEESAVTEMELGSASSYDKMIVDSISCGGKLVVKFAASYDLKAGDEFQLFESLKLEGQFASIELPKVGEWTWDTSSLYVNGTIKLVSGGGQGTGVELVKAQMIDVYPTAESGSLFEINAHDANIVSVQVYNTVGALIYSSKPMSATTSLDLRFLNPTVYIVKIQTTKGGLVTKIVSRL